MGVGSGSAQISSRIGGAARSSARAGSLIPALVSVKDNNICRNILCILPLPRECAKTGSQPFQLGAYPTQVAVNRAPRGGPSFGCASPIRRSDVWLWPEAEFEVTESPVGNQHAIIIRAQEHVELGLYGVLLNLPASFRSYLSNPQRRRDLTERRFFGVAHHRTASE